MDVIRLRTLAEKSILGFGKYADMSVGQILTLKHTRYLRWCYYHCSMISFHVDILDKVSIFEQNYITKPGVDPEMYKVVNDRVMGSIGGLQKHVINKTNRARIKEQNKRNYMADQRKFSKGNMQSKNHGH
jgi:hypothetical protein